MPLSSLATSLIGSIVSSILGATPDAPPEEAYTQPESGYPGTVVVPVRRMFPAGTELGILAGPPHNGMVKINGISLRTAPGLQIRNENNVIILPTMVNQNPLKVRYRLDTMGNAWHIWILTPAEIAQAGPFPEPPDPFPAFLR
jgi:hypothetical protein